VRICILSDTHLPGLIRRLDDLWPSAESLLSTADLILHAGDVTDPSVLDWLEQFADVCGATGNNDELDDRRMKPFQALKLEGWHVGMAHDLRRWARTYPTASEAHGFDVLIGGHTHVEALDRLDGVVFLNPGSPILPHHKESRLGTIAVLELTRESLQAEIIRLGETPGRPNPGKAMSLVLDHGPRELDPRNT
jgi:putative phosphoesterase